MLAFFLYTTQSYSQLPYPEVPIFQYTIFYNLNLEVDPGGAFPIIGPVFSNAGIWSGTGNATYSGTVEAVGPINTSNIDPFCGNKTGTGGTPASSFLDHGQPVSGVVPVTFSPLEPDIANAEAIINLPPAAIRAPLTIAYVQTNQLYAFNAASLIVSNWYYGTNGVTPWSNNFTVYLQDSIPVPFFVQSYGVSKHWVQLTNDSYIVTNITHHTVFATNYVPNFLFTNDVSKIQWVDGTGMNQVWHAGFSFLTNVAFYDFRESAMAQAVQLDVGKLGAWIANSFANGGNNWNHEFTEDIGHGINSIFIYNAVPFIGQKQLPAVRLVNGQLLPCSTNFNIVISGTNYPGIVTRGLTVVTPQPLYVESNYNVQIAGGPVVTGSHNTTNTYPTALMADSITILSSSWVDQTASSSGQSYTARQAIDTTINAAFLEGIVPSGGNNYSGGVENFPRLLENWAGHTLTYNGSIVVMFPSVYATNLWQAPSGGSSYYGVPTRNWAFDSNFLSLAGLPPLTWTIVNSNSVPMITAQPTNAAVLAGQTTNFMVSVSGMPAASYQWQFNGTNILDATNASLVLSDLQSTNAGNYAVQVTNLLGSVISSNALLSVYTSAVPVMSALSFSPSSGVQFTVSGVPGFNYAVQVSTNLVDWAPLTTNDSSFGFADTNTGLPYRFYRSVYLP